MINHGNFYLVNFCLQLEKELGSVRGELAQYSQDLNQAVALKEDLLQQQNKELSQAEQDIGTAEHQIQSQRDSIHSLQHELVAVSLVQSGKSMKGWTVWVGGWGEGLVSAGLCVWVGRRFV